MQLNIINIFKQRFGLKIFSIFTFSIFVIVFSFTIFFFHHQSQSLTSSLIQENLLLADILAYNSRIGVFSENEELLKNPVDAIFQQKETEEVSIYNSKGHLLKRQKRFGPKNKTAKTDQTSSDVGIKLLDRLKSSHSPFYIEKKNYIEFWSTVIAGAGYRAAESLFVENRLLPKSDNIIGFVRIAVGKSSLNKELNILLIKSSFIGIIFWIAGALIVHFMVRRIVDPLKTLKEGAQTLGKGDFGNKVAVETEDEIGMLATAFNQMSESLLKREEEKKLLGERLRHSQRMETIGTLAGGIAHDFNNILGVIVGYAQMALLTNHENAKTDNYLKEIFHASTRGKDLVKQILTFSRQVRQEQTPLQIKPIIEEIIKMTRVSMPATIEIKHNIKDGLSPVLSAPAQIHQVLMNLFTNAVQAMEDGGGLLEVSLEEVKITAGDPVLSPDMEPGLYQIMTVSDTGHGMNDYVKERVFDPFFTTKMPGKGTGMGLSVVHGIVKSLGGKISCLSEPGKGSTFKVLFPVTGEKFL